MSDALTSYRKKRDFTVTPEPSTAGQASRGARAFVIQKHWASRLHYDFRIELGGAMKSWAIPKGPSLDPKDKRMAVHVEDHPISYNSFEGEIPSGQYGAGKVIIWDKGSWEAVGGDPLKQYRSGHLKFELRGHKLHGRWALIRMKPDGAKKEAWLLIKEKDDYARPALAYSVVDEMPDSVARLAVEEERKPAPLAAGRRKRAKMPAGVVKAALPRHLAPQLATLVDAAPGGAGWLYEIKFDGYRLLARVSGKSLRLYTRNGNDWTAKLPALKAALERMKLPAGWYDGEIVVLDERGLPDFQRLQQAFDSAGSAAAVSYYLFDLPFYDGYDMRGVPLLERRKLLQSLFNTKTPAPVRLSDAFDVSARDIVASACRMGLEGVIGKRQDSLYVTRRSGDWIKLKCTQRQEFVIGGYTDPQGSRIGVGSLLLGVHDADGKLRYAGNVGTGFDARGLAALTKKLKAISAASSPFSGATGRYRKVHWVEPLLLAEVSFAEWTADGHIRHSVFHGLRSDKQPQAINRESAMHIPAAEPQSKTLKSLKVTHGERVIDAASGITKIELIRYYGLVAPLMLLHLKGRPVSLLRAPDGIAGQLFFQKHLGEIKMHGVRQLTTALDPGHPPLLEIAAAGGLLSAAQMNVIEFHTWNALKTSIMKPDRMTFDLDPGEKTTWESVQQAALLLRAFLQQLELEAVIKTSGGKGLHVVVPIRKHHGWDTV
ncbi:DNA ligase D, partial [Collimonas fungivorans]|uniref:DNA ligase D n=1 Tax=Collimonas fungivorans TaxID=158899 RepID=UPI0026EE6957